MSTPTLRESYTEKAARLEGLLAEPTTLMILCQRVAEGETVKEIARAWDVPHGRLSAWLLADRDRYEQYCRAQQVHAHTLVEETLALADDADNNLQRAKVQIETRFRLASFHAPARYGESQARGGGTRVQVIVQRSPQVHTEPLIESTPLKENPNATDEEFSENGREVVSGGDGQ